MHSYCLFCETRKCASIADIIERDYHITCISPKVIQRKWVKGQCVEEKHDWLQGYIFLYSEESIRPWFNISGILRWLGRDELQGNDRAFAEMLYKVGGVMGTIQLAQEGDRCTIDDPAWAGMNGTIIKIDRGRKRCCVEFEFAGTKRNVWLGYDMVKPVDTGKEIRPVL